MNEFIVNRPVHSLSVEEVTLATFGFGIRELVRQIIENRDGQFDSLYVSQGNEPETNLENSPNGETTIVSWFK